MRGDHGICRSDRVADVMKFWWPDDTDPCLVSASLAGSNEAGRGCMALQPGPRSDNRRWSAPGGRRTRRSVGFMAHSKLSAVAFRSELCGKHASWRAAGVDVQRSAGSKITDLLLCAVVSSPPPCPPAVPTCFPPRSPTTNSDGCARAKRRLWGRRHRTSLAGDHHLPRTP
jgi:hypothetical protein